MSQGLSRSLFHLLTLPVLSQPLVRFLLFLPTFEGVTAWSDGLFDNLLSSYTHLFWIASWVLFAGLVCFARNNCIGKGEGGVLVKQQAC